MAQTSVSFALSWTQRTPRNHIYGAVVYSYLSLVVTVPTRRGMARLSWPRLLVTCRDGLPAHSIAICARFESFKNAETENGCYNDSVLQLTSSVFWLIFATDITRKLHECCPFFVSKLRCCRLVTEVVIYPLLRVVHHLSTVTSCVPCRKILLCVQLNRGNFWCIRTTFLCGL